MSVKIGKVDDGVVNYDGLRGLVLQTGANGNTEVWLGLDLGGVFTVDSIDAMQAAVQERIESDKKPAGYLSKAINRIYLHKEQLNDALVQLFTTHSNMVSSNGGRRSAVWNARFAMLTSMSNKVLRLYAMDKMPDEVGNYILDDVQDRLALVTKLTTILADEKDEKEDKVEENQEVASIVG